MIDKQMGMDHWWNEPDRGNPKYSDKNLAQRDFVDPKSNTGLHGEGPKTNRLSHGAAKFDRRMGLCNCRAVQTQNV
jgi:hypothetical protein